jgi:hypothetical protein
VGIGIAHRGTGGCTFPYQAGDIRTGDTWFGVRWRADGELKRRMVKGTDPAAIRDELRAAFDVYNAERERRDPERRPLVDALRTAAELYVSLLRIHPALQGALISLGAAPVHFEQSVAEHDEAIGGALRPNAERRTIGPFVELLRARIDTAARAGWRPLR